MSVTRGLTSADGNFFTIADMRAADLSAVPPQTVFINDGMTIKFYDISESDLGSAVALNNGLFANPTDSANSWGELKTANFNSVAGDSKQIDASANTVDVTLLAISAGDPFIYHNLITSTFKVQILNPTQTIKGTAGDFAPGINVELAPGDSIQMVAKSAIVLSIVGAQV